MENNTYEKPIIMNEGETYMAVADRVVVLAAGEGVIEPTDQYTNEQVVRASDEAQRPVEDPHVVCIDARGATEAQPVREKEAGGNLTTNLHAAAAIGWSGFTESQLEAGPESMLEEVADTLVDNGIFLGAHRHTTIAGKNSTGCGAVDKSPRTMQNTAEHGMDTEVIEQAKIDLGEHFNPNYWRFAHAGYERLAQNPKWQSWETSKVQEVVEKRGGVVETLKGEKNPELDPHDTDKENVRHGHWEEGIRINSTPSSSNDRDGATVPLFQVDLAPIIREAQIMTVSAEEFGKYLHAAAMFQYMTAYTLTKNQRIIR